MGIIEKELNAYYKAIYDLIPSSRKEKRKILSRIKHGVDDYRKDHPLHDFSQVLSVFGAPESIAASYVDNMSSSDILKTFRIKKRLLFLAGICALTVLITWGMFVTVQKLRQESGNVAYIRVETTTLPDDYEIVDESENS